MSRSLLRPPLSLLLRLGLLQLPSCESASQQRLMDSSSRMRQSLLVAQGSHLRISLSATEEIGFLLPSINISLQDLSSGGSVSLFAIAI